MTAIAVLLALPEGKTLEFKRDLSSFRPVLRTLVAFANTAGGTLVVGRTAAGDVVGVEDVLQEEEPTGFRSQESGFRGWVRKAWKELRHS